MCVEVDLPSGLDPVLAAEAETLGRVVAETTGAVGVFAVELFVVDGRLLVNEIAPRVHNSGHVTIEGARTSQFEQHLRAVLDWPLGPTDAVAPAAVMVNVVGGERGRPPRPPGRRAGRGARGAPPPLRQDRPAGAQGRSRHRARSRPGRLPDQGDDRARLPVGGRHVRDGRG